MKIRIKLFAVARQWAGADSVEMDLPANATVGAARAALLNQLPKLSEMGSHLRFAVDEEYADDNTSISAGSNVACIPPVSGG
jgi:sulfur-carrier protein